MAKVIFSGELSAQVANELVIISVMKPDGTIDTFSTTTLTNKTYSVSKEYADEGAYTAVAHVNADGVYDAVDSNEFIFRIGAAPSTYTINASAGANGSISPSGAVTVDEYATQTFTITPNGGYAIDVLTVDGNQVYPTSAYHFINVVANHSISVTFAVKTTATYEMSFDGAHYQVTEGGTVVFGGVNNAGGVNGLSSSAVFNATPFFLSLGCEIYVKQATYSVDKIWIVQTPKIHLTFELGAKLVAVDNLNTAVLLLYSDDCDVDGIELDGNASGQTQLGGDYTTWGNGLYMETDGILYSGNNNQIRNANIYNCRVIGVGAAALAGTPSMINNGVIDSKVYNCGWNGCNAGGWGGEKCYVINTEIWGCGDVGISIGGNNSIIQYNDVHDMNGTTGSGNTHDGILVEGGENSQINHNTVKNCVIGVGVAGMSPQMPANNATIDNNTITYCFTGVMLYGVQQSSPCTGCIVSNNTIAHMTPLPGASNTNGIVGKYAYNSIIYRNKVSYCTWEGCSMGGNNNTIEDNDFFNNYMAGVDIQTGDGNKVLHNKIYSDGGAIQQTGIIVYSPSPNTVIEDNTFYGHQWADVICTNQIPNPVIRNNTGYNPRGTITVNFLNDNYIVDGTVQGGNSSTWVSGVTYTNSGSPKTLNIVGGVDTKVTKNGQIITGGTETPAIFSDGFETGDLTAWSYYFGQTVVQSSIVRNGNYACQCVTSGSFPVIKVIPAKNDLFVRFYIYFEAIESYTYIATVSTPVDNNQIHLVAFPDHWEIGLENPAERIQYYTPINSGQWYCVEFERNANGTVNLWIDEVNIISDVLAFSGDSGLVRVGKIGSGMVAPLYTDEVVVSDKYIGSINAPSPSAPIEITLQPGDTFSVTYTAAPTIVVSGQ